MTPTPSHHDAPDHASEKRGSREALLDSAAKLFAEKGYAAVGTREIAADAGANLGMIKYHFGSKGELFVAAVHQLLERDAVVAAARQLHATTREEAVFALAKFVVSVMESTLRPAEGPQACQAIYREVFGGSCEAAVFDSMVESVAKDFKAPMQGAVADVIGLIRPQATRCELELHASCLLGACWYFAINRPFLEKMSDCSLGECARFEGMTRHVARFGLAGVGCEQELAERAIDAAMRDDGLSG
ncbi:MAG: helix-turn-helix domain-containing protein [Phycisphaerales bacterium]|jgi:AcrR family transcriptional regulator